MSSIDDLIQKLCPSGVKFCTLGDVGTFVRGQGLQKKDFEISGIGCIHYGQIYTCYTLSASRTISFVNPQLAAHLRHAHPGDLVIATTSENDEDVCKAVAWLGSNDIVVSGDAYIYRHSMNPKYVAYLFQSELFQKQKKRYITGTKVRRVSGEAMAKIRVPVPPLVVQAEIVRILDSFTSLEAELEAELEARKKQYEYYRDRLLSEDGHGNSKINDLIQRLCPDGVRKYKLHDIAEYSSTRINATKLDGTSFVGVDNLLPNKAGRVDASYSPNTSRLTGFSVGDLLIGNIRPYLKKIWIADREGGCSGDVLAVHVREEYRKQVHPRFFYYLLSSDRFFLYDMQYVKGAKMPRGNKDAVMKFCVLVPPLVVQAEIVAVLDRFDALVNDLSSGLPAEIAARRKQYEYYRDRLLSFKELRDE